MSGIIHISEETRQLLCAVDLCGWGAPICRHPHVDLLARAAFARGMITPHQRDTAIIVGELYKKYHHIKVCRLWSRRHHDLYRVWCRSVGVSNHQGRRMLRELLPCEQVLFVCRNGDGVVRIYPSAGLMDLAQVNDG